MSTDAQPFHWEPYPAPTMQQSPRYNQAPGIMCPDGGTCHHNCADSCFRVGSCGPLSGVFPNDDWPDDVVRNPAPVCLPFLPATPASALRPPTSAWEQNPFLALIHSPEPPLQPIAAKYTPANIEMPDIPVPPLPPPPLYVINTPYPEPPTYTWDFAKRQWVATHPLPLAGLTPRRAPVLNRNNRGPYSLHDEDPEWDASVNGAEACTVDEANILTSEVAGKPGMHKVALDIDLPAKLLPSSTPGHWHLYIDRELPWETYTKVLDALAEAGIIETGYARASKIRGYTSVRPPWLPKTEDERTNGGRSG